MIKYALLLAPLTGCFVEVDVPKVLLTRACDGSSACTVTAEPAELPDMTTLVLATGATDFAVDLGEQPTVPASQGVGPATLDSVMSLDALTITAHDGVRLDGITQLSVSVVVDGNPQLIASYDGAAGDASALTLAGTGANLLAFGTKFAIRIEAAGHLPATDWKADLAFTASLDAKAH